MPVPAPASKTIAAINQIHHKLPPLSSLSESGCEDTLSDSAAPPIAPDEFSVDVVVSSSEETFPAEDTSSLAAELLEAAATELVLEEEAADDVLPTPPEVDFAAVLPLSVRWEKPIQFGVHSR